jgi:hypothetical protein
MNSRSSRRSFLAASLTLPAAALANPQSPQAPPSGRPASGTRRRASVVPQPATGTSWLRGIV